MTNHSNQYFLISLSLKLFFFVLELADFDRIGVYRWDDWSFYSWAKVNQARVGLGWWSWRPPSGPLSCALELDQWPDHLLIAFNVLSLFQENSKLWSFQVSSSQICMIAPHLHITRSRSQWGSFYGKCAYHAHDASSGYETQIYNLYLISKTYWYIMQILPLSLCFLFHLKGPDKRSRKILWYPIFL